MFFKLAASSFRSGLLVNFVRFCGKFIKVERFYSSCAPASEHCRGQTFLFGRHPGNPPFSAPWNSFGNKNFPRASYLTEAARRGPEHYETRHLNQPPRE
jgi:hypothetical protein